MATGGNFPGCGPDGTGTCDPVTTTGLCLADGTPIGVVITRDCASGTVAQIGWINLTAGTFTDGQPPAGTIACGESRSIQVSGVFCDLLPDGTVAGLVLVEYQYAPDGSIASTRLVDAATGADYTLQGVLSVCPAGIEQPERDLVLLCDVAADGTVTQFVRDYARDENGAITGHSDYLLDGAIYTPAGTVTACDLASLEEESPAEPCLHCETLTLCDSGDPAAGEPIPYPPANGPASGTLGNGVVWAVNVGQPGVNAFAHHYLFGHAAPSPIGPQVWTFDQMVSLRFAVTNLWSPSGPAAECVQLPEGVEPESVAARHTWDPATRTVCGSVGGTNDLLAESIFVTTAPITELTLTDVSSFDQSVVGTAFMEVAPATPTPFLRTICRDCDGQIVTIADTDLDGDSYTVTGDVGVCGPATDEACRNTSTLLVCDLPTGGEPDPTLTDTDPTPYLYGNGDNPLAGGAAVLWAGGTLTIPPDAGAGPNNPSQNVRAFAATVAATRPACDTGTATVTATVHVERTGPDPAVGGNGLWDLIVAGTRVAFDRTVQDAPVGYTDTLTVTAQVPADALAAGDVVVFGEFETWHAGNAGGWTIDQFSLEVAYDQAGCAAQVFANVVTDCDSGDVVSITYTTLDGAPYTPTGDIGQCESIGGGDECPTTILSVSMCDVIDGDVSPGDESVGELEWATIPIPGAPSVYSASTPPWSGTLPNGVTFSVADGEWWDTPDFLYGVSGGAAQEWKFSEPVVVRFGLRGLGSDATTGNENKFIQVPIDVVPVTIHPDHRWDPALHRLYRDGSQSADESTFVTTTASPVFRYEVGPQTNPAAPPPVGPLSANGVRGLGYIEVAPLADPQPPRPERVCFLRRHVVDCHGSTVATLDVDYDGQPYTIVGEPEPCTCDDGDNGGGGDHPDDFGDTELVELCDLIEESGDESGLAGPRVVPFLRRFTFDRTGETWVTEDLTLAGDPYTTMGEVGNCATDSGNVIPEPCRDTVSELLCDEDTAATPVTPTVADGTIADTHYPAAETGPAFPELPKPWTPLWSGAALVFPADPDGSAGDGQQVYRTVVGRITGIVPDNCADASGTLTVSVRVTNNGPSAAYGGDGWMYLYNSTVPVARASVQASAPVGYQQTLTATMPVTAEELAGGNVVLALSLETFHATVNTGSQWTADQFTVTSSLAGCRTQFRRVSVIDCETGDLVSQTDTTLDGDPYTPTGQIGQCLPTGGESCQVASTFEVCACDDVSGDGTDIVTYTEVWAIGCDGGPPTLLYSYADEGPGVRYEPVNPVPCSDLATPGEQIIGAQARRAELAPGGTWSLPALAQSVTVIAVGGQGTITDTAGTTTLYDGMANTWSVVKDTDLLLSGPLAVTATTGVVVVLWTEAVTA